MLPTFAAKQLLYCQSSRMCVSMNSLFRSLSSLPTQSSTSSIPQPTTVKSKFYIPRHERTSTDSMYEIDTIYDKRIKRRRRRDPTRELNYTASHWENHKSPWRRTKHILTTFGASPFQRLLVPDLLLTSCIAGGLTYYNEFVVMGDLATQIYMSSSSGVAAGTTAIAILTGFRLNASYGRYKDARKQMSTVNTVSRDLATNTMMWITKPKDRQRMLLLIKAYSVALTFQLNKKGNHVGIRRCVPNFDGQVFAEYQAEMKDVFHDDENNADYLQICNWFHNKQNVPIGIATLMRNIIASNDQKDAFTRELDIHVQKLLMALGGAERIQKTPIPTCLTRHTSRLLFVWSNMMPFAAYSACGPWFTLPVTIAISYSIMGIEDIGVQLEEPFNILPLRQYSDGVYDAVDFIASVYPDSGSTDIRK